MTQYLSNGGSWLARYVSYRATTPRSQSDTDFSQRKANFVDDKLESGKASETVQRCHLEASYGGGLRLSWYPSHATALRLSCLRVRVNARVCVCFASGVLQLLGADKAKLFVSGRTFFFFTAATTSLSSFAFGLSMSAEPTSISFGP